MRCKSNVTTLNIQNYEYYREYYDIFYNFYSHFKNVHGYIASAVIVAGLLVNACYIIVLTRPKMCSIINTLLTAIAVCDSILMTSYLTYLVHFNLQKFECRSDRMSKFWQYYSLAHAVLSVTLRAASLWLASGIGCIRVAVLQFGAPLVRINAIRLDLQLIIGIVVIVFVCNSPLYLIYSVESLEISTGGNKNCSNVVYMVSSSSFVLVNGCWLIQLTYWINGIFNKLIPVSVIAVCIVLL